MSTGNFKQDVYAQLARVGKALSSGNRLELLEFVAQGPRSVEELATMTRLSVANASKHLQELRRSGLVQAAYACVVPLAAPLVRKGNGIAGAASVADGLSAAQQALDFVASRQRGYLAGDRFSLADLTVASALAAAVDPVASPMSCPRPYGAAFASFAERFSAHPGAAWVRGIYARHRMAASDFEGASSY